MSIIKDIMLWVYWNPFKYFVQRIPIRYIYLIGRCLGALLYHIARNKRKSLEYEYVFVTGEIASHKTGKETVKASFRVYVWNELEVLLFPVFNKENISYFVTCEGLENLDNALAKGKGAMLLFAHFGANQMVMPTVGYNDYKMSQLSAPPMVWKEKLPDKKFTPMSEKGLTMRWKHELSLPVTHINIFGSLKKAFLCLKKNEVLGIAIDGGGGRKRVTADFLGRKAQFSTGSIEIAMRTGCAVLPTFMLRNKDGYNKMIVQSPIRLVTVDDQRAIQKNIQLFAERLERYVLQHPDHYLNFLALRRFMSGHGDRPLFIEGERT